MSTVVLGKLALINEQEMPYMFREVFTDIVESAIKNIV